MKLGAGGFSLTRTPYGLPARKSGNPQKTPPAKQPKVPVTQNALPAKADRALSILKRCAGRTAGAFAF